MRDTSRCSTPASCTRPSARDSFSTSFATSRAHGLSSAAQRCTVRPGTYSMTSTRYSGASSGQRTWLTSRTTLGHWCCIRMSSSRQPHSPTRFKWMNLSAYARPSRHPRYTWPWPPLPSFFSTR
nr:hypothetical protein [Archangium sp.]